MNSKHKTFESKILLLVLFFLTILIHGCSSGRYMLDEPVSDPIMTCDDQRDSDLVNIEEGAGGTAGGGCPT